MGLAAQSLRTARGGPRTRELPARSPSSARGLSGKRAASLRQKRSAFPGLPQPLRLRQLVRWVSARALTLLRVARYLLPPAGASGPRDLHTGAFSFESLLPRAPPFFEG